MAVSLKLPTFWEQSPELWFIRAEAEFANRHITADGTKYNYLVASLGQDTATAVLSALRTPPDTDRYKALKDRLLEAYGLSQHERAARLLEPQRLGDESPAVLMEKMENIRGDLSMDAMFRWLFLRQMPDDIRAILVAAKHTDNRQLALAAEELWKQRRAAASPAVHTVAPAAAADVAAVRRAPAQSQPAGGSKLCYYHRVFGDEALKCSGGNCPEKGKRQESGNASAGRQ